MASNKVNNDFTIEGFFMIPYNGQIRFSAKEEDGEIVFENGKEENHKYFDCHFVTTTHQYNDVPDRQKFLKQCEDEVKNFIDNQEATIKFFVPFSVMIFGQKVTADGEITLYRLFN